MRVLDHAEGVAKRVGHGDDADSVADILERFAPSHRDAPVLALDED